MQPGAPISELKRRSRRLTVLVIGLTLAVLAAAILGTTWRVRSRIRQQIVGRDGEVLHDVAVMECSRDAAAGLVGPVTDPGNQLTIVLKSAELRGVLGMRLCDVNGAFVEGFPPDLREAAIEAEDLAALRSLRPVSHFQPAVPLAGLFYAEPGAAVEEDGGGEAGSLVPLLRINVPLHTRDSGLVGIAQFLVEGGGIAAEYARLDRYLGFQAAGAFVAGGGIVTLAMIWAFRRLRRTQDLLAARTSDLAIANQELALAAKTSAVGAIASHLVHDLRNPMLGLESFMARQAGPGSATPDSDWGQAAASTRRMLALIDQVAGVLREERTGLRYEVTLEELCAMVADRVRPLAMKAGIEFRCGVGAPVAFPNHTANLTMLVLVNLLQNAVQATPRGKAVGLDIRRIGDAVRFEIRDEGPGFPADRTPFMPCHSAKPGGAGIGLAISRQLAQHLGATLGLERSTSEGCVFVLVLPLPMGQGRAEPRATAVAGGSAGLIGASAEVNRP